MNQKVIELLVEARPKLQRVGFLVDSTSRAYAANVTNVRRAADRLRVEALIVEMARPGDIEPVFVRLAKNKVQALVILASSWFAPHVPRIMELAVAQRWPVASAQPGILRAGGLFFFGADYPTLVRRTAYYVDRILKGAKPADLPIEEPTAFELVINMKAAAALGVVIPQSMMLRATGLIE